MRLYLAPHDGRAASAAAIPGRRLIIKRAARERELRPERCPQNLNIAHARTPASGVKSI
jgi:hypothetical protein